MRKSSLVLPAKYQNQARLIKQRKYRHSLEYRSMPVRTILTITYYGKSQNDFSCHETWRNNVTVCWQLSKLPEFVQYRSVAHMTLLQLVIHDLHVCGGISITPLWGVYHESEYKLLNVFYYHSISYKINNNHSSHVTWRNIATNRRKSAEMA